MRNILFVLVFISITVLGCGGNKSSVENCTDERFDYYYSKTWVKSAREEFLKKSYKKKMQNPTYKFYDDACKQIRDTEKRYREELQRRDTEKKYREEIQRRNRFPKNL